MIKSVQEAIKAIRELPDEEQDTIAEQLMHLMSLASLEQDCNGVCLRRRAFVNGTAGAFPPSGFNP